MATLLKYDQQNSNKYETLKHFAYNWLLLYINIDLLGTKHLGCTSEKKERKHLVIFKVIWILDHKVFFYKKTKGEFVSFNSLWVPFLVHDYMQIWELLLSLMCQLFYFCMKYSFCFSYSHIPSFIFDWYLLIMICGIHNWYACSERLYPIQFFPHHPFPLSLCYVSPHNAFGRWQLSGLQLRRNLMLWHLHIL